MQETLLSIAIALILALVTALVGPHFVDWNKYRAEFETQASRMTGLQVRIAGPIEARLLPTPSMKLSRISIARGDEAGPLRARRLSIEFSLGSLARGEFRATDVILEGAEIAIALDRNGRLDWPAPSVNFDPDAISIERLDIRDSRALLADAASGYGMVLDKLEFKGELRTLSGPVKGAGSFYADGMHYPYRLAMSRVGDGRLRVRFGIDPIDRPLTFDTEGFLSVDNGAPGFTGNLTFARPVTRAPSGSQAEILEPWRLTGKLDGNSTRAVVEQIEFQYGPDERPIRLRGDARINFGAAPRLIGVLSSPQIDLDRILALPEPQQRRPLVAIKTFADLFAGSQRLPLPVSLGISVESLTLAGATLQRFSADFASTANGWDIEKLELRAPGLSQLAMAGRLGVAEGISFSGRTRLSSKDPRTLLAWLTDRPEDQIAAATSLSVDGDFKLSSDEVAVDRLKAELDRMSVEGRLAYAWGRDQQPPRIEAVMSAPDIDLDRAYGLLRSLFEGSVFEMPREGLLSAKVDRATLAGVEARRADIGMRFDANGVNVERLGIGDFGGVSLAVTGNIDTRARAPRGIMNLDLDARRLDGVAALLERWSPEAAAELRRNAARVAPAKLNAAFEVRAGAAPSESNGRFRIDGSAGALRVALNGDVNANSEDLTIAGLARLRSAHTNLVGDIAAPDAGAIIALLGLDRFITVEKGAGRVTVSARGAIDGEMAVDGRLVAGNLDTAAKGRVRLTGSRGPTADMEAKVAGANIRSPRVTGAGAESLPAAGSARLALAEGKISLSDITGTVAGTNINGRLTIGFDDPISLGGELSLGALHLPATIAAMVGLPPVTGGSWPSEPFERGLIGTVEGGVKLRVGRVALSPQLGIANMRGTLHFGQSSFALEEIDGSIAGGRVAGSISFERGEGGLSLDARVRFAGADLADLLPGEGALTGRATIDLDLQGTGRSPIALIGALNGDGTFTIQDGQIMRANPAVFAAVIRSVDDGLPIDAVRISDRTEAALGNGALNVALAQGEIAIAAGQLRLANTAIRANDAELGVSLGVDLSGSAIDARMVLSGAPGSGVLEGVRPEIALALRGPFEAPRRTLDVAAFTSWLAMRAIEEKDKRIDALQSGRELPVPPTTSALPKPLPNVTNAPDKVTPATPQQVPKASPPQQRAPAAKTIPSPPTDIRPPAAARQQMPPPKQAQPQRPASRSWLENLLGP
ncbi:MAG: AsmA family protein [Xanthobacteraceae bacterium]|nr:AsmA family protein [Xanthobacteraceae bacterium]